MKSKIKRIAIISAIILGISILFSLYLNSRDNLRFKFEYERYNNVKYSNGKTIKSDISIENKVKYLFKDEIIDVIKNETSIIYFGYDSCPWCRNIAPVLVDVTNKSDKIDKFYYFNVNQNYSDVKDELYEILSEYVDTDEDGQRGIYVPRVFFIKNGKVLYEHLSAVESYTNPFIEMTNDQKAELSAIYNEGIDKLMESDIIE